MKRLKRLFCGHRHIETLTTVRHIFGTVISVTREQSCISCGKELKEDL